jgi:methylmalonyl-CoA mutase
MTRFAEGFASVDESAWRKRVEIALKGGAYERLLTRSEDGFDIAPLYPRAQGPRAGRGERPWRILARVDHPEADVASAQAVEDLEGGADGLEIIFAGGLCAYGYGLRASDPSAIDLLFRDILLEGARLELDPGPAGEGAARNVAAYAARQGLAAKADIAFGLDPIGLLAAYGRGGDWCETSRAFTAFARDLLVQGFRGPFLAADGRIVHAAGGSASQELAYLVSAALLYLRALEANGLHLAAADQAIGFRATADADEFVSLVKFRALRLLWSRVREACALAAAPMRVHASSGWRNTTTRDPYVNVLRGAMAAFAAGLGGADSVTVLPFTQAIGLPDSFARRVARNSQLILLEESNLGLVEDPAAGSGAFEALTHALCEKSWAAFQKIETEGGLLASLERGELQADVAEVASGRARDVARRKAAITGVSDFPNLDEIKVETLNAPKPSFSCEGVIRIVPLTVSRLAEPFEALREASDAILAATGARPKIFLANLGPIAAYTARTTFAKSFFEAGGLDVVSIDGFLDIDALRANLKGAGARLACLCSSEEIYAAEAEAVARALASLGVRVWLAGRPGAREQAWREAGIEQFIFVGCDALAALRDAHRLAAVNEPSKR